MWVAVRKKGASREQLMELARTIDRMTGVMSTSALGVGKTQQDIENAFVFFSPRYTRAGMSLMGDVLKGGMTGAEARKALGMFLEGGFAMYYGSAKVAGQQPNLNPSSGRFLTLKVGNQHLGIGGINIAMMRLMYDIGITATEDPANLVKPFNESGINRWDNPFIKFMYSRTAPLTSFGIGAVIEQSDYYGAPFENIGDWANFVKDKVTPIALQDVTTAGPVGIAGQIAGLRQFPLSASELLTDERDRISQAQFRVPYSVVDDLRKRQIDKSPTIMKLQDDVDAQTVQRGDAESMAFLNHKREMDMARETYVERLNDLQRAYDNQAVDGVEFRKLMSQAGTGLGATYEHINKQTDYKEVLKKLKSGDLSDKTRWDMARIEFAGRSFSPDMEDEYGIFDFAKYDALKQDIIKKYGQDAFDYIMDFKADRDKELPPLAQEYQRAKETMKPYREIQTQVEKMFGQTFAESSRGQSFISKQRRNLRLSNPQIAAAYDRFYKQG